MLGVAAGVCTLGAVCLYLYVSSNASCIVCVVKLACSFSLRNAFSKSVLDCLLSKDAFKFSNLSPSRLDTLPTPAPVLDAARSSVRPCTNAKFFNCSKSALAVFAASVNAGVRPYIVPVMPLSPSGLASKRSTVSPITDMVLPTVLTACRAWGSTASRF